MSCSNETTCANNCCVAVLKLSQMLVTQRVYAAQRKLMNLRSKRTMSEICVYVSRVLERMKSVFEVRRVVEMLCVALK